MKRPIKKPKEYKRGTSIFESYVPYSPKELRDQADYMEQAGIMFVEFMAQGSDGYFYCEETRLETQEEAEKRYKVEYKKWKAWKENEVKRKEKEKAGLIKKAKELGMTFNDGVDK